MSALRQTPAPTQSSPPITAGRRAADRALRLLGRLGVALSVAFLLAPAVVIVVLSFSGDDVLAFPPRSWGMRQYSELFSSEIWMPAIWLSLKLAAPSALLALLIGVPASLAIVRTRLPGRFALQIGGIAGMIVPVSAYAVAMYGVFAQFELLGSFWGLVIANAILGLPFVLVMGTAALTRLPVELELVAITLGASRLRAWVGITLRLMLPAIFGAAVLAFVTAFDEAVFINFLGGPDLVTMPKAIFDSVRYGVDPAITAIATLLMVATGALMSLPTLLRKKDPR